MKTTKNKRTTQIYALTFNGTPGETLRYFDYWEKKEYVWIVPNDGEVLFYIGETSMGLANRYSKHRTYARKLLRAIQGEDVYDPHCYLIYRFICEVLPSLKFNIKYLGESIDMSESEWISSAKAMGITLINTTKGSTNRKP